MSSSVASSHTPSYRLAVSSIPTSIVYSPESIYIVCQLRRSDANSEDVANAISDMHQTGSALTLIRALVDHVLKSNPKPPSLQHAIDLRDVVFTTLKGSSPTYAIHFSAMMPNNGSQESPKPSYARRGTDLYNSLEQLLLSFVFDKWHEKVHDLAETLSVSKELLQSIHFLMPPLNYPMYRPVAFLSGFSPSSFGRRFIHLDFLIKNIHVAIKPHLDPTSLLHNPVNFRQAFGIEARTSYVFTKDKRDEAFIVYMSNVADLGTLSPLLYTDRLIKVLGVPVTFFPIPARHPESTRSQQSSYYSAINKVHADLALKRTMMASIPSFVTQIVKQPLSPITNKILVNHHQIITYTVIQSNTNNHILTKLFLRTPLSHEDGESILRSWFKRDERQIIFAKPKNTSPNRPPAPPASIILNNVLKNSSSVLTAFAETLGIQVPTLPAQAPNEVATIGSDTPASSITHTSQADLVPTQALPPPRTPLITQPPSPTKTPVTPTTASRDHKNTTLLPRSILSPPTLGKASKRGASKSPDTTTTTPSRLPFDPQNDNAIGTWDMDDEPDESATIANSFDDGSEDASDDDSLDDDNENELSIRINHYESLLTSHIPKHLRQYMDQSLLTTLANDIYLKDDDKRDRALRKSKSKLSKQTQRTAAVFLSPRPKKSTHDKKSKSSHLKRSRTKK